MPNSLSRDVQLHIECWVGCCKCCCFSGCVGCLGTFSMDALM